MLSYERYEALVNRLNDLEDLLEDIELEQTFGYRLNTPAEEWAAHRFGGYFENGGGLTRDWPEVSKIRLSSM